MSFYLRCYSQQWLLDVGVQIHASAVDYQELVCIDRSHAPLDFVFHNHDHSATSVDHNILFLLNFGCASNDDTFHLLHYFLVESQYQPMKNDYLMNRKQH